MQQVKILFLGGAKRVSIAERFIDAGRRLELDIKLFSYELTDEVPVRELATIIKGKYWTDTDVLEHITSVCQENEIDILIPFVDPATILAPQISGALPGCFIPSSSESLSRMFYDKREAQSWFEENDIDVPYFTGSFPAIAKPVHGSASNGLRVLYDKSETDQFFQRHMETDFLMQRLITGEEYSVDCYVEQSGKIIAIVPRIRLQVAGGEVIKSQTVNEPGLISITEEIIRRSGLTGPLCIQFIKEAETGKLFAIEVNPRFGGGVLASIEAGADMPFYLLNEYLGNKNKPCTDWQAGVLMMRAHREFFKKGNA